MALVDAPENWSDARLGEAVWSDPVPFLAVQAAVYERAVAVRRADIAEKIFEDGYEWSAYSGSRVLRDTPSAKMASTLAMAIRYLANHYVDMEADYAAKDWASFPVPLATRMARGGHPMGIGPGLEGGEAEPAIDLTVVGGQEMSNPAAWRVFLADCRHWIDRMTVAVVPTGDWGWTKWVHPAEGATIAEQLAHLSVEEVAPMGRDGGFLEMGAWRRSAPDAVAGEPDTSEGESGGVSAFFDMRVRNLSPFRVRLGIVSCGGPGRFFEVIKRHGFFSGVEEDVVQVPIARFETSSRTASSWKTTVWSDDYSESFAKTEENHEDTSGLDETHTKSYADLPWPELHGLNLGMNAGVETILPGGCVTVLPYFGRSISVPSTALSWEPDPLHGHNDRNEYNSGSLGFVAGIVPVFDFSASFRFTADPETP